MNNETTFENARVGDRVESSAYGPGEIVAIHLTCIYPLVVSFSTGELRRTYTLGGKEDKKHTQTLFWPGSVKIDPQPRPERLVEKPVTVYAVFDTKDRRMLMTSRMLTTYQTMSMAEQCIQGHFDYKRYKIVPLSGVVTIEE